MLCLLLSTGFLRQSARHALDHAKFAFQAFLKSLSSRFCMSRRAYQAWSLAQIRGIKGTDRSTYKAQLDGTMSHLTSPNLTTSRSTVRPIRIDNNKHFYCFSFPSLLTFIPFVLPCALSIFCPSRFWLLYAPHKATQLWASSSKSYTSTTVLVSVLRFSKSKPARLLSAQRVPAMSRLPLRESFFSNVSYKDLAWSLGLLQLNQRQL